MTEAKRYVVGRVEEFPPGTYRVRAADRWIALFNTGGEFAALRDVCPHQGAELSAGNVVSGLRSAGPGDYALCSTTRYVRCPWHGWEYDLETGQSSYDPANDHVRAYEAGVERGAEMMDDGRLAGRYVADVVTVTVDGDYVILEV